jgi:hypothetical protein
VRTPERGGSSGRRCRVEAKATPSRGGPAARRRTVGNGHSLRGGVGGSGEIFSKPMSSVYVEREERGK